MKEKLPFTKTQKILEILSLIIMIGTFIYVIITWNSLPDTLASHYNALGEADAWSGRSTILILPIFTVFLYALLTGVLFISPEMMNSPIEVTPDNRSYVQKVSRDLICTLKLVVICDFTYMTLCTAMEKTLSPLFLPILLGSAFIPTIVCIAKMFRYKKKNISK